MLITTERPAVPRPALTTTVAKEYVHRAALAEVFLTGWHKMGDDHFVVTAQWPRSHSFYASEHGFHDPLLLCESVRQTFPLLTHAAYGVPFGHQLSWSHFRYRVIPEAMRAGATPADIELHIRCSEIRRQRVVPSSIRMDIEAVRDNTLLAVASARSGIHAPAVYQWLRRGHGDDIPRSYGRAPSPTAPVHHDAVGRHRPQDVVLTSTGREGHWQLRVDTSHPVLFDHPVDHVPGMLLLEAVRQAGHALATAPAPETPTFMDVRFHQYVEFGSPCWIDGTAIASPADRTDRGVRVDAHQNGTPVLTAQTGMTDLTGT
ncbi:ScbA/BarX family gamma-butyrolactone biosynthesis protein [Streptomyces sp. NPDC056061]|uniref:ScbA/BarX family gamma-butyrolactone biosynthesis protein n=1 Tax=Streptomyces sp. NPDC056061 TaxID=3345700 RepID=UPI0035DA339D